MNLQQSDTAGLSKKSLVVPREEMSLQRASLLRPRRRWGSGLISLALGFVILVGVGVALALAHISMPAPHAAPILVQSSPPLSRENSESKGTPVFVSTRLPSLPQVPQQVRVQPQKILTVVAPELSFSFPSIEQLGREASEQIALLEELERQEEERMNELLKAQEEARQEKERLAQLELQKRIEAEQRERELIAKKEADARKLREVAALRPSQARVRDEQVRVNTLARQVSRTPTVSRRSQPRYPVTARKAGIEGTTRISATVTSSGKVESPRVVASSGHRSLDSSALAAVKKWRFHPAKNALGDSIAYQLTIPVTFRLN